MSESCQELKNFLQSAKQLKEMLEAQVKPLNPKESALDSRAQAVLLAAVALGQLQAAGFGDVFGDPSKLEACMPHDACLGILF